VGEAAPRYSVGKFAKPQKCIMKAQILHHINATENVTKPQLKM
jgi:hypothetical protein